MSLRQIKYHRAGSYAPRPAGLIRIMQSTGDRNISVARALLIRFYFAYQSGMRRAMTLFRRSAMRNASVTDAKSLIRNGTETARND